MPLLQAQNLSHSFDYPLFKNISLTIDSAQSIAIVGVSGSGKSTLLHILSTLLKPKSGVVKLFDKDIYSLKESEIIKIRRELIGIVFQSHYLFKGFSAYENILISSLLSKKEIDSKIFSYLGIEHILDKKVLELSGGEQQRVSIARVLVKKPKIIFADEPTGNLDKKNANSVMEGIFSYIQDKKGALFLVTHDLELAKKCTKVYELKEQKLVEL